MITHKYTIMCDEVRREDNGKFILIGVFADSILVNTFPATLLGLTFFVKLEIDDPGIYGMKMRLEKLEGGEPLYRAEGAFGYDQIAPVFIPARTPPVTFNEAGAYNFVIEFEGTEPFLYTFSVNLAEKPIPPR